VRVFISGASGFLGRNLAQGFAQKGFAVTGLTRFAAKISLMTEQPKICWHTVEEIPSLIQSLVPAIFVHAATCYGRQGESNDEVSRANFEWPKSLLSLLQESHCLFVNIDTSLPATVNSYADAKRRFSDYAREFAAAGGVRVLNCRLESVYGPGDDVSKFQMLLLKALLRNEPVVPLTEGMQTRDYIYIQDAVNAILLLVQHRLSMGCSYLTADVGTGIPTRIRDFAWAMKRIIGSSSYLDFGAIPYRKNELMHTKADIFTLKSLGWTPETELEEGLRLLVDSKREVI